MQLELLIILSVIVIGFLTVLLFINKKLSQPKTDKVTLEWLKSMQNSLDTR